MNLILTRRSLFRAIKKLEDEIEQHSRSLQSVTEKLIDTISYRLHEHRRSDLVGSQYHQCDQSPIEICVYDNSEDANHDSCLFCHQPEERK